MKTIYILLFLQGAIMAPAQDLSIDFDVILPTEEPTGTPDPWQCATENVYQYFDFPMPTGALEDEVLRYGQQLFLETCTVTGDAALDCPPATEYDRQCGISTAAPPSLLPEYSAWASAALSWWTERSSTAHEIATECPHYWYKAMTDKFLAGPWLNTTLAHAQCIAKAAHITGDFTAPDPTATSESGAGVGGPEETGEPNGVVGRAEGLGVWMVAATGLAAASITNW